MFGQCILAINVNSLQIYFPSIKWSLLNKRWVDLQAISFWWSLSNRVQNDSKWLLSDERWSDYGYFLTLCLLSQNQHLFNVFLKHVRKSACFGTVRSAKREISVKCRSLSSSRAAWQHWIHPGFSLKLKQKLFELSGRICLGPLALIPFVQWIRCRFWSKAGLARQKTASKRII